MTTHTIPGSPNDKALIEIGIRQMDSLQAAAGPALPPIPDNDPAVKLLLSEIERGSFPSPHGVRRYGGPKIR
jgi:hypothetical protein